MLVNDLTALEKPVGTIRILLHLAEMKETTISSLVRELGMNQRTAYSALDKLLSARLIYREEESNFPRFCKKYYLTDHGLAVAMVLRAADLVMKYAA
jgi:DNA-binding MarR family transcriptional regulator